MEGPEKVFQETKETGSCYRCRKPLDDDVEIKGICEDCLKLESIQVQTAFRKLREANTIGTLHQNLSETLIGYPQTPTEAQAASKQGYSSGVNGLGKGVRLLNACNVV